MRKLLYILAIAALFGTVGCKTTEANYKAAYEAARQRQLTGDSITDNALLDQERPKPMVFGSDTLPVKTEYIGYTKNGGADTARWRVKRYCVITGKFKQVFNARMMRERLMSHGYHNALVLHNNMKDYYVVANTTADPHVARLMLDSVMADTSIVLKAPFPYILRPGHLAR